MGVKSLSYEVKLKVSASRIFDALVMAKSPGLLSKVYPDIVKSYGVLGGGPVVHGCTMQTAYVDGSPLKNEKFTIEALDTESLSVKWHLFEGGGFMDKFEKIIYDINHEASSDGGCVIKLKNTYHGKGDSEPKEEDINAHKELLLEFYKTFEAYLIAHPDVCA